MKRNKSHSETIKAISSNIKRLRKEHQKTQEQMADLLKVSTRYYQMLESEKNSPNLQTLIKLANIFDVHLLELFKGC